MASPDPTGPKVSVVIPSYNHGRYLGRRLESVLAQTFQDFEVVFLDDASGDDSRAVFAKYRRHPKVRAILNDANTGNPFVQWNRGVRAARGEYVWLAESDDLSEPHFLERLVPVLDAHPNVGLAYSNSLVVDESGAVVARFDDWIKHLHPTKWLTDHVADGPEECRRYLARCNTIPNASAVLFRRELYERVGGADETTRLCGDWSTWAKLLCVSDAGYLAEPLNHFRAAHAESQRGRTATRPTLVVERLAIFRQIDAAVRVPDEVRVQAVAAFVESWTNLIRDKEPAEAAACCGPVLRAADRAGADYPFALLAATLADATRTVRSLDAIRGTTETIWGNVARLDGDGTKLAERVGGLDARTAHGEARYAEIDGRLADVTAAVRLLQHTSHELRQKMAFWEKLRRGLNPLRWPTAIKSRLISRLGVMVR